MNVRLVTLLVITVYGVSSTEKKKGDPCTAANEKPGTCVPLNTCPAIFNALGTHNFTFTKTSLCSFEFESLVCCDSPGPVIVPNFETKALPDKTICGVVKEQSRILGGEAVEPGELPWVVSIEFKSKITGETAGSRCGGALINNRYVVTAAHCIIDREFEPVSVSLGESKISTDPDCRELLANIECADPVKKVSINKTIPHYFYSRRYGSNDIGLIRLESDVEFTDYISPVCLPFPNIPTPELGTRLTVAGWGATENGTSSDVLLKVHVPVVSNEECRVKLNKPSINSEQLCAGGEVDKDSCGGDAGGPLMRIHEDKEGERMQWYLDGVVSHGIGCGRAGYPAIYTRVASHLNWIINVISEN